MQQRSKPHNPFAPRRTGSSNNSGGGGGGGGVAVGKGLFGGIGGIIGSNALSNTSSSLTSTNTTSSNSPRLQLRYNDPRYNQNPTNARRGGTSSSVLPFFHHSPAPPPPYSYGSNSHSTAPLDPFRRICSLCCMVIVGMIFMYTTTSNDTGTPMRIALHEIQSRNSVIGEDSRSQAQQGESGSSNRGSSSKKTSLNGEPAIKPSLSSFSKNDKQQRRQSSTGVDRINRPRYDTTQVGDIVKNDRISKSRSTSSLQHEEELYHEEEMSQHKQQQRLRSGSGGAGTTNGKSSFVERDEVEEHHEAVEEDKNLFSGEDEESEQHIRNRIPITDHQNNENDKQQQHAQDVSLQSGHNHQVPPQHGRDKEGGGVEQEKIVIPELLHENTIDHMEGELPDPDTKHDPPKEISHINPENRKGNSASVDPVTQIMEAMAIKSANIIDITNTTTTTKHDRDGGESHDDPERQGIAPVDEDEGRKPPPLPEEDEEAGQNVETKDQQDHVKNDNKSNKDNQKSAAGWDHDNSTSPLQQHEHELLPPPLPEDTDSDLMHNGSSTNYRSSVTRTESEKEGTTNPDTSSGSYQASTSDETNKTLTSHDNTTDQRIEVVHEVKRNKGINDTLVANELQSLSALVMKNDTLNESSINATSSSSSVVVNTSDVLTTIPPNHTLTSTNISSSDRSQQSNESDSALPLFVMLDNSTSANETVHDHMIERQLNQTYNSSNVTHHDEGLQSVHITKDQTNTTLDNKASVLIPKIMTRDVIVNTTSISSSSEGKVDRNANESVATNENLATTITKTDIGYISTSFQEQLTNQSNKLHPSEKSLEMNDTVTVNTTVVQPVILTSTKHGSNRSALQKNEADSGKIVTTTEEPVMSSQRLRGKPIPVS